MMQTLIDELIHYYFIHPSYEIESVPFGLTNLTKIVKINDRKYVVRIYDRYTKNVQSMEMESKITSFLSGSNLTFQVPVFLRTLNGEEYIQLADGTLGAVVSFIEGRVPEIVEAQQALKFGQVVGEISSTLSKYETDLLDHHGKAFSDLYDLHPLAHRNDVTSFIENPPFHISESHLNFYKNMILSVEMSIYQLKSLPRQLVHHDLLIFNLLSQNNNICGVLDFDFTSIDASFMEFAISLNHISQMSDGSLEMTEAYIKGYAVYRKATIQEINHLQHLTQIYHIAVLHIYIGQHYSGKSIEANFNYILHQFQTRNNWLNQHREALQARLELYLV
ncbi:phosphotransferase [Paenibacillus sp. MCAF9]|uniref:phosphotransferase n=1 Tax=Paenibacillus sp. MCAF9 TaxID=3233046 RepID=UPI003F95AE35